MKRRSNKDRRRAIDITDELSILITRSSHAPVAYAIVLRLLDESRPRTIHLFDNAHRPDEHHEHAYVGFEKIPTPVRVWHGDWRRAHRHAILRLTNDYADIVAEWRDRT